jgi:hypothetical protein
LHPDKDDASGFSASGINPKESAWYARIQDVDFTGGIYPRLPEEFPYKNRLTLFFDFGKFKYNPTCFYLRMNADWNCLTNE